MCEIMENRNIKYYVFCALLMFSSNLLAQNIQLYSDNELYEAKQRYEPNVRAIFREDLVRRLPVTQRNILANATLEMPLRGKHPLQYSAKPWAKRIIIPVMSLKFIDDLSIVWAWFIENNCEPSYITSYLSSLLSYNEINLPPMQTFGLNMSVIKNERVNSLSLKLSKTAIYYILAHEAGHVNFNHSVSKNKIFLRKQEEVADNFALNTMERIGVMPAGMLLYFMAGYMFEPLPDLETWEYEEKTIAEFSHPLVSDRIHRIAQRLGAKPINFVHSEPNPVRVKQQVIILANKMSEIANQLDNGGMKLYSASWLRKHFPRSKFSNVCTEE